MSDTPRSSVIRIFFEGRFVFFLAALLLYLGLVPFLRNFFAVRLLIDVLFSIVFISAVLAVSQTRRQAILVSLLAVPMLIIIWLPHGFHAKGFLLARHAYAILFLVVALIMILRFVIGEKRVTRNVIYAAIVVYLLIGLTGSVVFSLLEQISPGSFSLAGENDPDSAYVFIYYSFVTLTTLGYGDVLPLTDKARALAILEAIIGQLYLVVLIARLVGSYISQSEDG